MIRRTISEFDLKVTDDLARDAEWIDLVPPEDRPNPDSWVMAVCLLSALFGLACFVGLVWWLVV